MNNLIDITGDDIRLLNDSDLRLLIGLLCEADYRASNLSTSGVTYGGNQDASDGGLDVVIKSSETPLKGFIKRASTGIQVKKPAMPRAEILKEMKPRGVLREEIVSLINDKGAYIIVSSGDSTTHSMLKARQNAMREAVKDEACFENLLLDFFDCNRVSSWVRDHPSIILWVRDKIGRSLTGWHPYDNWSYSPDGLNDEYLFDERLRFYDGTRTKEEGLSIQEGFSKLRNNLSLPKSSVRLTGLSGVGKTRLAQALFDCRIGNDALNPLQVFYTDLSDNPDPEPASFAEKLIALEERCILIIDNCSPDLHQRLTKICSKERSKVSLLTIEYDVREDIPDETDVYRLEPASEDIIEKIIQKRYEHISQVDAHTIAEFSGGNARVAIALANTVDKGESLSGFHNDELFERLFRQRNENNESLLTSAEALSLVYSFQGEDVEIEKSELSIIASLIGKNAQEVYRDVSTIKARGLVQARSVWRAILPHAIANRLASRALKSIPKSTIVNGFLNSGSERLIQSFTRRLSYLHDCEIAIEIVQEWLKEDGYLGKSIGSLNSFGMRLLKNVAPVLPDETLEAIERAAGLDKNSNFLTRNNDHYIEFTRLLRNLAYDRKLFKRCANLLCQFSLSEELDERNNSVRELFSSLFSIYLSGTHATIEDRAEVIESLIDSGDSDKEELGFQLLGSSLKTSHFSSHFRFDFGARSRDYGFYPKNREELVSWYKRFIGICVRVAISNAESSVIARRLLANNFRGLWSYAKMYEVMEAAAKEIHEAHNWNEGWIAVRGVIRFDNKGFEEDIKLRTHNLERLLNPDSLLERARTYAISDQRLSFGLEDDYDESEARTGLRKAEETTEELGKLVSNDDKVFQELLPDLITSKSSRIGYFGKGLAEGINDKNLIWDMLYRQFEESTSDNKNISILIGYLSACRESDPGFHEEKLDQLIDDPVLGEWFPIFQAISGVDEKGLKRLHKALEIDIADIFSYERLAWGCVHEEITDVDLNKLLEKIARTDDGTLVVIEILKMRFHRDKGDTRQFDETLVEFSCKALSEYPFKASKRRGDLIDYDLETIAKECLKGELGKKYIRPICQNAASAIDNDHVYSFNISQFLGDLAASYPEDFLDIFVGDDSSDKSNRRFTYFDGFDHHANPLDSIPHEALSTWCKKNPQDRCLLIAYLATPYIKTSETGSYEWKSYILEFLDLIDELTPLFEALSDSIIPRSWSGSKARIIEDRIPLLEFLCTHENQEVSSWAKNKCSDFIDFLNREREREEKDRKTRDESFE
jgi:hypothetical protein